MTEGSRRVRQSRRASPEVRDLILRAAHDLFATQGYHGTKTREIAAQADVAEPVIFRQFGSKAEIFEAAILAPFNDFVNAWTTSWRAEPLASSDPFEITRTFVRGFYLLALEHRDLLRTLMTARVKGGDESLAAVADGVIERLGTLLTLIRGLLEEHRDARQWEAIDPPVSVAVAVGSILSVVVFDEWVFPVGERRPGRERQIEELTQMLLHGIAHRAAPPSHQ